MTTNSAKLPAVVSRDAWLARRKELLIKEKEHTWQQDRLNKARRDLPMVEIDKEYTFEGPEGKVRLADLFEGRHQLIIYHFMFEPGDPPPGKSGEPWEEGCSGCSFMADNVGHLAHFYARDTSLVFISRAPLAKIAPFKKRMGWKFPWYSSFGSDFNYAFHVTTDESVAPVKYNFQDKATLQSKNADYHLAGEQPGISVFLREGERLYHTYSAYGRGLETVLGTYHFLDLTPFGRGEGWDDMPDLEGKGLFWTRHHDKYANASSESDCCHSSAASAA